MRRRAIVWFAVVATALVVLASPAAAATASSSNTTRTDFEAATTLDDVDVVGSGDAASVSMGSEADAGPADTSPNSATDRRGVKINPNRDISKIRLETFANTTATQAYVTDTGGVVIDTSPISGGAATIETSLSAGTSYYVVVDNGGSTYDYTSSYDETVSSPSLDITNGVYSSTTETGAAIGVRSVAAVDNGTYVSATHDVNGGKTLWTNLSVANGNATVEWLTDTDDDGTFETTVDKSTHTASGNKTLDVSGSGHDDWRVRVKFASASDNPTGEVHDEGVTFEVSAPTLSDPDPADGAQVSSHDGDVSINVSDPDFATANGDSITVIATNSTGGQIGSTAVTSNDTVTFSYSAPAGENEITWDATDDYGASDTLTQTFSTPAELLIRNETAPTEKVTTSGSAEVTFFGGQSIESRPINDGSVNLSGLPGDETFVAVIDVDGYYQRRVLIPSLYQQQRAFLLNESMTTVDVEFYLDDSTGQFSSGNVELSVQKAIEINGNTEFRTVVGDRISAAGELPATLEQGSRYRLKVSNEDGVTRSLGSWTATSSGPVQLPIGRIELSGDADEGWVLEHSIDEPPDSSNADGILRLKYLDEEGVTDSIETQVVRLDDDGNVSEVVLDNATETDTQSVVRSIEVNNTSDTFAVRYTIERGGETYAGERKLGTVEGIDLPMDDGWLNLISWVGVFGFGGLIVIKDSRAAGVVMAGSASLFAMLGWLNAPVAILGLATAGAVIWAVAGYGGGY